MKNILCYGDSNTFGTNPSGGRWDFQSRWTGRLALGLGNGYRIIEEGLGGRSTVWDDPLEPHRNGLATLPIFLRSHRPLDLVILSLGTNDCKTHFNATPRVIAKGAEKLIETIRTYQYGAGYPIPQILLISPIHIGRDAENSPFASFDASSYEKSLKLAPLFQQTAELTEVAFFDAAKVAFPSAVDQLHMDADSHNSLAEALAPVVRSLLQD